MANHPRVDAALLLLRGAALLLLLTFGLQKAGWYVQAFESGQPLASAGLAPLIRKMGFPAPGFLALLIAINETFGALLVAAGFFTRPAALALALGMIGALSVSLRLGEDPLRAFLYALTFVVLTVSGPGRWSIDRWMRARGSAS
jgi:putative oxidoreductase